MASVTEMLSPFHFCPPGVLHPITTMYELSYSETEMKQDGVVESCSIIDMMGTCQIALVAHNMNKPVYVAAQSYKVVEEMKAIGKISGPMALTGLLIYTRAVISMMFLGYPGEVELAAGSLSIGFANITGYSGLAMGMEPICGQAFGAKQWKLLGLTLQRTVFNPSQSRPQRVAIVLSIT